MRLLDTKRLELVDVRVDAIPPYAVLSHTWGDEEVTFQELQHMRGRMPHSLDKRKRAISDKKGFLKVKDAAALAVSRGYSYIWVDTCCIDKSSSAELSEAINSMYLWYQQSEECYAFLSDVKSAKEENWSAANSSLRRSRWFTRGWTLQELIAPKAVRFYAKDWTLLGHKDGPSSFMKIISEVTGIDPEVLDRRIDPLQLSVSARMKWASHRHTTRLEDTAYCLMGLFQVNMPLLYGEGHRAFTRLQEEIIQRSDDQSLYAWNSFDTAEEDPDALSGLLAMSPAHFKDAGNIQPLPPSPVYPSAPSAMTNHGLRVQLYLRPILEADGVPMEEDYYAILDCFVRVGDLYQCPVIRLRRLSQDQYARLQTKSRKLLPALQAKFPDYEGYRTIYVRQHPVYYHLPQFRVSPLHVHSDNPNKDRQHYELTQIFPHRQWNSTTMTMEVKYSRKLQAMGVFRFQSPFSLEKKVDLVVGLRRLDAMQWEGWCFQRSCEESSVETTLSVINQKIAELTRIKSSAISSGMLRESLGDDSRLMTDATVEGIQLQGRLYISISMSLKPEIHTVTEQPLLHEKGLILPAEQQPTRSSLFPDGQVRALTDPCSRCYATNSILLTEAGSSTEPMTVRGKPAPSSGIGVGADDFMKPLHDFLDRVRDQKAKIEPESSTLFAEDLALAIFEGNQSELDRLLKTGAYLDSYTSDLYGFGPLHWAVAGGSIESIRTLLRKGVSPLSVTREGWTAIHVSALLNRSAWKVIKAHDNSSEVLDELANNRTNDHLETALHLAAAYCSPSESGISFFWGLSNDVIEYASLFARNKHDETPLHRAAAFNNVGVIRAILCQARGDIIDVVDQYGRSPLWHAAATGSCDAITVLISENASIDLTDDLGRSPLHAASRGGYDEAVEILLQEGARQSTATSMLGLSALDYAAMFGHAKCLKHLLYLSYPMHALLPSQPGALNPQNNALRIAASCGWLRCVDILCQSGADPFVPMNYHLKLNDSKIYAIVVEEEGDAVSAATIEGHLEIVVFFNTSDACKAHRQRKISGNDKSTGDSLLNEGDSKRQSHTGIFDHSGATSPVTDYSDSIYSVQDPPLSAPPNPLSQWPESLSTGYGVPSAVLQRYQSTSKSYKDSSAPVTTSFSDRPSRIGSHSTTVPAFAIQAYPRAGVESKDSHQYQPAQSAIHPRLSRGQTPSAYNPRQTPINNSHMESYDISNTGPPQSDEIPHIDAQEIQRAILANLVGMLGKIGNPELLVDESPTDPMLLRHDPVINRAVYQRRDIEGAAISDHLGFPIFEVAAGFELSGQVLPEYLKRAQATQGEPEMRAEHTFHFEDLTPSDEVGVTSHAYSSVVSPGSWDRL